MSQNPPSNAYEKYQTVAETVGMVPSLNARDNLIQGLFVLLCSGAAFAYGSLRSLETGFVFMLFALIGSGLLSGAILMIVGLIRAARRGRPPEGVGLTPPE